MNKMISYLFWGCIPLLFFSSGLFDTDYRFCLLDKNEIIEYDLLLIWFFLIIYFSIIGFVFKRIKIENYYLTVFGFFTIVFVFLFFHSMIDHKFVYQAIAAGYAPPDIFEIRTTIFYIVSSIWLVAQIIFWFKIIIHFFNQEKHTDEVLDESF